MLQEIFKGMPNASEAIDENFKEIMPQDGVTENGGWVKLSGGTLICWGEVETTFVNSGTLSARWDFPMPFNDDKYFADGVNIGIFEGPSSGRSAETVAYERHPDYMYFRKHGPAGSFTESDKMKLCVYAIGRWKE